MRTAVRRSMMGVFAAAAIVVVLASVAWACVPAGMTNANPWFCKTGTTACTFLGGNRVGTGAAPYAHPTGSYYSMLGGAPAIAPNTVSPNTAYTLTWVTGNHSSLTDPACYLLTTGAKFKQTNGADASFTTNSTGSWRAQGPVSMPSAGVYTICAVPTTSVNSAMSNHYYPFVVT